MVRVVSLDEYRVMQRPELFWMIPRVLPKPAVITLLGEPKAGKSFLALQLAMEIAKGGSFLGQPCRQGKVLYVQLDTSELVWRDRLNHLKAAHIELPPNVQMIHPEDNPTFCNIILPEHQRTFRDAQAQCEPDVVVIDVLREIHSMDEQDSTQMKIVGDILMEVFAGRTLIILHHMPKTEELVVPKVINAARGSSYISGKSDAIWMLHNGFLYVESRFDGASKYQANRLTYGMWSLVKQRERG